MAIGQRNQSKMNTAIHRAKVHQMAALRIIMLALDANMILSKAENDKDVNSLDTSDFRFDGLSISDILKRMYDGMHWNIYYEKGQLDMRIIKESDTRFIIEFH